MKVLVTGSAGHVGRPVCQELVRRGHDVRGLDRVATPALADFMVADIADAAPVREAFRGVAAVIHLAAQPVEAEFSRLVGPNVVGLFNVMDAARAEGVARVILTSSMMVVAGRGRAPAQPARVDEATPRTHYALTKLWAEQMGAMYVRCFNMNVLAVRLGWMVRNPDEAALLRKLEIEDVYVSGRDSARFFAAAIEAGAETLAGFHVVYAAGRGGEKVFDMEPARRLLGYEAQDRWPEGLSFELDQDAPTGA